MRVLHVAEILPGGISTYLNETLPFQAEALGAADVHVLVPASDTSYLPAGTPIEVHTYQRTGRNLRSVLSLARAFNRTVRQTRPDVVHAHSSFAMTVVRICGMFLRRRPTIVCCAHGWAFVRDVAPWKNRAAALVERVLARRCDGISSISYYEHDAAVAAGLPPDLLSVIRYGMAPAHLTPIPDLHLDPSRLNFFFIGRLDRQKGIDILLDVFDRLPDDRFRLYVAGAALVDGGDDLAARSDVELLGWIDHQDVDAYYRAFDALLVPSRWEGFGLVALEAMRNGVAVIASNRGALPEVVDDGVTGRIFDLDHPEELAELLLALDRASLEKLGAGGKQRYEDLFKQERMNREVLDLYDQAIARHAP